LDFNRNGNFLLLGGSKGHVAMLEWKTKKLRCEFQVKEKIRDIKFLHNESLLAVAQEKCLYIYDNNGTEVHRLKSHPEPIHLEFLPHHFLLSTLTKEGLLLYQDVSIGKQVAGTILKQVLTIRA
jgi:U3 small nucleolar RNA-associated protein 7